MLDAIIVIAQHPRMDHGEHLFVWSLRRTVSSCMITILRLADNYNRRTGESQVYKQVWAGSYACMLMRADMYSITIIFSYKFKIVNNKEKPPATGKLIQWWKQRWLSTCMILNCTSLRKKKKDTNKKIKKISIEIERM